MTGAGRGRLLGGARAVRDRVIESAEKGISEGTEGGPEGDDRGPLVLVTGATGGVGGGIVEAFVAAGARVVLAHRGSPDRVRELADAHGEAVAGVVRADLTIEADRERLVAECEALGGVEAAVLAAGVQPVTPLRELRAEDVRAMFEANVVATFDLTRLLAGPMTARGGGAIVAIASVEGHRPAVGHAHYAAAKAALLMHARAAALELGAAGIRINTVSPGLVDDGGLADRWPEGLASWTEAVPLRRPATPLDVGQACVFLASDAASFVTGTDLVVDGGMSAVPAW